MKRTVLGRTGLDVPAFVIGTAQLAYVTPDKGLSILRRGMELGANWWDTSDDYGTYSLIARAMVDYPREQLVISTKTSALSQFEGHAAIRQAMQTFQTDYLDIMFLHHVQDEYDLVRRRGCLDALLQAKEDGTLRAIGLSSHFHSIIKAAAEIPAIDVVMAPWNIHGRLPSGGSPVEMERAIHACYDAGKGVVLMKLLADGLLVPLLDEAIVGGARFTHKHALNIGVRTITELETDIRLCIGEPVDLSILAHLKSNHRLKRAA